MHTLWACCGLWHLLELGTHWVEERAKQWVGQDTETGSILRP